MANEVEIRRAQGPEDYEACIKLQKAVWNFAGVQDFAAIPLLLIGDRYGGSLLIAEAGTQNVGFSFALLCRKADGAPFWWSHMTAVMKEWRAMGVGFHLKLAQRAEAVKSDLTEVWWTFDPLEAMNAHFNIRKLGALGSRYEHNMYGYSSSPLHHGLPTDRILVKWHVTSPRVTDRIGGMPPVILRDFDGLVRVLESKEGRPSAPKLEHEETPLLAEIPVDFQTIQDTDPGARAKWQEALRAVCLHYFAKGYRITDFMVLETPRRQALYVLERHREEQAKSPPSE